MLAVVLVVMSPMLIMIIAVMSVVVAVPTTRLGGEAE
jgi:hypothetical protein